MNRYTNFTLLMKKSVWLISILLLNFPNRYAMAQNFSGLQNKNLSKMDDLASALASLIGTKNFKGTVSYVKVLEDGERNLKVQISFTGYENGYVRLRVLDTAKNDAKYLSKAEVSLAGQASPVELSIALQTKENVSLESPYIELKISKSQTNAGGFIFLYMLNKKWQSEINAENLVLNVTPKPVGSASKLTENETQIVLPRINKRYDFRKVYIPSNARPTNISSGRPGRMPTKLNAGTATLTTTPPLGLDQASINNGALGPDNNPISLWDDLVTDIDFQSPNEITNIRMDIYPDKNKSTGIYYYMPAEYHIKWDPNEGYNFKMCYGTNTADGSSGDIRISASILPGISKKENELIKKLLASYVRRNPGLTFTSLRLIPTSETPTITIGSELTNIYNIPQDKINVNVTSSLTDPIMLSFVTDNRTKEEMQVALLENIGINGSISIKIQNENSNEQQIPLRISLEDPSTLGRFTLEPANWRSKEWVNATLFPLKLKYIHVLMIKDENNRSLPIIYSYDLNNVIVPSKAKVKFDGSRVPKWFDSSDKIQRIWIDYSVEECKTCSQSIINEVTCSNGRRAKSITFESLSSIEKTKASFIIVKVRSAQCDNKGETITELPAIRIQEDGKSYPAGPLYLLETEKFNYDYFITVVMPDGTTYTSSDWIKSDVEGVYIGTHQLKQYIPDLSVEE